MPVLALTDRACTDVSVAGGKAARLAQAHAAGLPVAPGIVVPADRSREPLAAGLRRMTADGPHGAQLAVMDADTTDLAELPDLAGTLGDRLVARSSSPHERSGCWSGAFTSYLDVPPEQLLTAVRGVWASAFGRDALDRADHSTADEQPQLAVLVQRHEQPDFAGTATIETDGTVTVVAVAGSPAALLHGWEPGSVARRTPDGAVAGDTDEVGEVRVTAVADLMAAVADRLGDDRIEWAWVDGRPLLLQSSAATPVAADEAQGVAAAVGEQHTVSPAVAAGMLASAGDRADLLRAQAYAYAAVSAHGEPVAGVPAAPGAAAGRVAYVEGMPTGAPAGERPVLVAPRPLPHLAPLLWGACGLVTFGGSPAAHLVEVARSLNLPAVVGCRSPEPILAAAASDGLVAVDGHRGTVRTWHAQ